ncbi:MAG TPA: hypothetical protein VEO53_07510, partial [Candidatus Binatia bacterium]|nr:hypothetical protein [Candidatus Binatia bacterium]
MKRTLRTGAVALGLCLGGWSALAQTAPSPVPSQPGQSLKAVTFARGTFVAVGEPGLIAISCHDAPWKIRCLGSAGALNAVVCGKDLFIAVGSGGDIFTST